MASPIGFSVEDKDLDDAALWAVIDSAAAASLSFETPRSRTKPLTPIPFPIPSPDHHRNHHRHLNHPDGEVVQNHRPHKIFRSSSGPRVPELNKSSPAPLVMVNHLHRSPITPTVCPVGSPEARKISVTNYSPDASLVSPGFSEERILRHSLAGPFPTVSLFKEYQNAAMAILEKSDYTMISGNPYIKKSGWRKISFYFNLSYEIKDKTIEFDDNHNVQRAEFVVRSYMQGGRFSDGWGSCERREKRFMKPNHDIPSTAETRAKNKACQDLLGIGEYRPGASHGQR
ncbi:hypothetical protein F511_13487 [Dorcoceras hygrometricum]|uniref:Uncharacterized protein n=1 Tax=Dorcoceras hygrometricum TaxID=472368 RepID=A0A2Z7CLJ8_9LAMI|nr:hypothetical protein F511_13487 [Dorcoceras hygrometricum]